MVQQEWLLELRDQIGALTPKLEQIIPIHILKWIRIEEFMATSRRGAGRPPHERTWLANALVTKGMLSVTTTGRLIERLAADRALRRTRGFGMCRRLPSATTQPHTVDEFAKGLLAERV